MVTIEVKGINKLIRNLRRYHTVTVRKAERGLNAASHFIQRESQKIVPVQTGFLKGSAGVRKEGKLHYVVGYFGGSHPDWYAAWVHEIPGLNIASPVTHGKLFNIKHAADFAKAAGTPWGTAAGGMFPRKPEEQWKYLEKPIKDNQSNILKIIANEIKKP